MSIYATETDRSETYEEYPNIPGKRTINGEFNSQQPPWTTETGITRVPKRKTASDLTK